MVMVMVMVLVMVVMVGVVMGVIVYYHYYLHLPRSSPSTLAEQLDDLVQFHGLPLQQ